MVIMPGFISKPAAAQQSDTLPEVLPQEKIFFAESRNHQRILVFLPRTGMADPPEQTAAGFFLQPDFPASDRRAKQFRRFWLDFQCLGGFVPRFLLQNQFHQRVSSVRVPQSGNWNGIGHKPFF